MAFLERSTALDELRSCLRDAITGCGSLVFICGEMGIGKTTLVDRFAADTGSRARFINVSFDGLSIPAPLGPVFDAVDHLDPSVALLLRDQAPRTEIFRAIESELRNSAKPIVLAVEDAHWSDEASLDLLRYLGRRIGHLRALVIVTFRDDELPIDHPLRGLLGDLTTLPYVRRIELAPLSLPAVAELVGESSIDPHELHAYTGGNPFLVSEILSSGSHTPRSLQDMILGRASRLSSEDRLILEAAAVMGATADPDLLQQVATRPIERAVSRGLSVGLLRPDRHVVAFRHAAVQSALLLAISPVRYLDLHRRTLSALQHHPILQHDSARLAFHAEQALDWPAALAYADAAARTATAFQSHREATEQFARALRCGVGIEPSYRAELLEAQAYSFYLTARITEAVQAQEEAAAIREHLGQHLEYGLNLRRLSRFCKYAARHREGYQFAEKAHTVLERFPVSGEFALACGYLAEWRLQDGNTLEALALGERALSIANQLVDAESIKAHALISVGMTRLGAGDESGRAFLEAGLDVARRIGHEEYILRALAHLAAPPGHRRSSQESHKYIGEGLEYANEHDLATMTLLFGSMRLFQLLDAGEWEAVIVESQALAGTASTTGQFAVEVLVARALARLRTGVATADDFAGVCALVGELENETFAGMASSAMAEAAWLGGDNDRAGAIASASIERVRANGDLWVASELALWAHRSGNHDREFGWVLEPYRLEIQGDWKSAARMWQSMALPLESARSRSFSTEESELQAVLAEFGRLDARPDALRVVRRLRDLGFRHIPRGPRPSTRATFGLLTRRELEILVFLAQGTANRTIATQLFLSPKTIDHHVSAILDKLNATNRQQAVNLARDAGLIPK